MDRPPRRVRLIGLLVLGLLILPGCQIPLSLSRFKLPFGASERESDSELASIDGITGPLQRFASGLVRDKSPKTDSINQKYYALQFATAKQFYDSGDYVAAEEAFKKIANQGDSFLARLKKKKKTSKRSHGNPYQEDALFYVAECQFHRRRFSWAQDSYVSLMKQYPSTQHMDKATKRLFEIAKYWLGVNDFDTTDEILQVGLDDSAKPQPPRELHGIQALPIVPNLFDRERPVFDTGGRALQALKSIWLNDPTGPLADDALMLSATYHLRKENYAEADRVFGILREEYPKSPHLEKAFELGSHVKLMSYEGPAYDDKQLIEAEKLKKSTLRLFPNIADRERLQAELKEIEEAKAQRDWEKARFYLRKRKFKAVAIYCNSILENFPNTSYADKARDLLAETSSDIGRVRIIDTGELTPADGVPRLMPHFFGNKPLRPVPRDVDGESESAGTADEESGTAGTVRLSG